MVTNFGPSALFIHFLQRLFSLIMGRYEEPNMGLLILGSQCYEERGNGQLQSVQIFQLTATTLQCYVKGRQKSSSEAIKQNWVGSKFFLVQ